MTVQAITAEILRDRDRVPSSHNVVDCFACGRSFLYEGPHGDDSGRFCHQRCREWFDAGNPPYAPLNVMSVPLRDWKVICRPAGGESGGVILRPHPRPEASAPPRSDRTDRTDPPPPTVPALWLAPTGLGEGQSSQKIGQILRRVPHVGSAVETLF